MLLAIYSYFLFGALERHILQVMFSDISLPLKSSLSTSTFNQTPSATEVKGLFDMSNSSLKTKVANQSDTSTITYPVSLPLNTCTTNIQSGEYYYYQGTDDGSYQNNIYFSLMGTPDRSLSLNQDSVGNITVTIKPAGSTTKVTKS